MPPGFCYLPLHCLPVEELVWRKRFCVCVGEGGGGLARVTLNKREGEERNMEVLFITLVGE